MDKFDFSGWATKANLRCSDGRIINQDAFKHCDGLKVPLVWNHGHNDPLNVIGNAILEHRDEGVYTYGTFNDSEQGQHVKGLVQHGDVVALSIFANHLKQKGPNVIHGDIREVSVVLAGANPGAFIDNVMAHSDDEDGSAIMYVYEEDDEICLEHSENSENKEEGEAEVSEQKEKTIKDVYDEFTEEQKTVVQALVGAAVEEALEEAAGKQNENNGGNEEMKHNVFEGENNENTLKHNDIDVQAVFSDAKRYGSLKDSALAHGIDDIEYLFPEATNLNKTPEFIKRETGWVAKVMNGVHKSPFSRIKSQFADIREDDARAKGYIKGKLKKEEVFGLLKRSTTPTTIYKKQKLDRDDVIDITDFDVVAWIKGEMRMMLDEEIARAVLIGDGRSASSDDKINEGNIRPIYNDEELFTVQAPVKVKEANTPEERAKLFIKAVIKSRKEYKGTGEPTLFTTEDLVSDCLLIEDANGRVIYDTMEKLRNVLRVKEIVTVPVMEGAKGKNGGELLAILVNLKDYYMGADKGGAINMFEDFDIDYNQQKYLIETRCSGALVKPFSAIAYELEVE